MGFVEGPGLWAVLAGTSIFAHILLLQGVGSALLVPPLILETVDSASLWEKLWSLIPIFFSAGAVEGSLIFSRLTALWIEQIFLRKRNWDLLLATSVRFVSSRWELPLYSPSLVSGTDAYSLYCYVSYIYDYGEVSKLLAVSL